MVRRLSPHLARLGGNGVHARMPRVVPHAVDDGDCVDDCCCCERRARRRPAGARDDLRRQPGVDADENAPDAPRVRRGPPGVAIPGSLQDGGCRSLRPALRRRRAAARSWSLCRDRSSAREPADGPRDGESRVERVDGAARHAVRRIGSSGSSRASGHPIWARTSAARCTSSPKRLPMRRRRPICSRRSRRGC